MDAVITKNIIQRERLLLNRNTVLQTRNKKTFASIIDVVTNAWKRDEEEKKQQHQKKAAERQAGSYDRYGEVEEDRFWKDRLQLKGNGSHSI
jgi:hypothetical protein